MKAKISSSGATVGSAVNARAFTSGAIKRKPKRQQPERAEQAAIVKLLRTLGAAVYVIGTVRRRNDSHHGTMQTPGIPDLYAFLPSPPVVNCHGAPFPPVAVWIEVKAATGRLSPEQRAFRDHCDQRDAAHIVGGIDHVQNWLVDHGWLRESERRQVAVEGVKNHG